MSELFFHKNEPYSKGILPVIVVYFDGTKIITCTNGTKTYVKQGTNSCSFEVPTLGVYTLSCTGLTTVTITVDAVTTFIRYMADEILNNNSWDFIKVCDEIGSAIWNVGDRKAVTLSGTFDGKTLNSTWYVYILGFDHNSDLEGKGISFGTFKTDLTGGIDICIDGSQMNATDTNVGGWNSSKMRGSLLGGNVSPASAASGTLMYCFPSDLKAVIKKSNKYTDNVGNNTNVVGNVTETKDYLYLLSEFEVQGTRTYANQFEQNYQKQYDYYKNGNSKIKYKHTSTTSAYYWWLRSPNYSNAARFCSVNTGGSATGIGADGSYGVSAAFLV